MKISVVIPAYNEEKTISRCLDSIVNQLEKPDEIIVVDNNSLDKTAKIAEKYPNVKIIKEKRQGIAHARNAGFNKATGDILARCDADSIIPKNWLKQIKKDFESDGQTIAVTPDFHLFDMAIVKNSLLPAKIFFTISKLIIKMPSLIGPAMAIRKSAWEKVKNDVCVKDADVHEDIDLTIHLSKFGKIYLDHQILINMSARRIKFNPVSFFGEYPWILIKMLHSHRHLF